jgi:hypothetical protein
MPEAYKRPFLIRAVKRLTPKLGLDKPLDFDEILRKARKHTGLKDPGQDFNDEAVRRLIRSINEEARLHSFGRLMAREKLVSQLENRLWAEHWFARYPEILDQELLPIILVTGLQRTGTTRMQRLISGQDGARALLTWEAMYPAPLGHPGEVKKRMARTRRNERAVRWISPTFHAIHPIHFDKPEEDILLLDLHFMSSSAEAIMHVPSYAAWLSAQDQSEAYAYERKLLLLLQWQRGGRYWVLKTPHHLEFLPAFASVFPDTRVIWMHRQLDVCIPSFLSMLYHSRSLFSDHVDMEEIRGHWMDKLCLMVRGGMISRAAGVLPVMDILYEDVVRDEPAVLNGIADQWEVMGTMKLFENQRRNKPDYKSRHRYALDEWGLTKEDLYGQFKEYHTLLQGLEKD